MSRTRLPIEEMSVAERFIDRVGFCSALTDARRAGSSMYVAVCGRRDAYMPRNEQEDPEAELAWAIKKDEQIRLGEVYYGNLKGGRATFIGPRLIPHFSALFGVPRARKARSYHRWCCVSLKLYGESGSWEQVSFGSPAAPHMRARSLRQWMNCKGLQCYPFRSNLPA